VKGRSHGPLQTPTGTIPASNKPVEIPACQVVQVEGGKIKSGSHYFDLLTMLTQIGATSAMKSAA
jgi:ketosteroid isomerase-like protein